LLRFRPNAVSATELKILPPGSGPGHPDPKVTVLHAVIAIFAHRDRIGHHPQNILGHHPFKAFRAISVAKLIERKPVDGGADLLDVGLEANIGEIVAFIRAERKFDQTEGESAFVTADRQIANGVGLCASFDKFQKVRGSSESQQTCRRCSLPLAATITRVPEKTRKHGRWRPCLKSFCRAVLRPWSS
jgi:hypothetical protein